MGALNLSAFCWIAFAAPKVKPKTPRAPVSKVANPLRGVRLPIPVDNWEGEPRNADWQDLARVLRVRDLRVFDWPSAYNLAGVAEGQKRQVLRQLQSAGYKVEEFKWELREGQKTDAFEARRGNETLSAIWGNNGSHLFLYWGHQVPETPTQKRNDELIAAVLESETGKVHDLMAAGADPRALDYSGVSVLTWAAERSNSQIVGQILGARKAQPKNTPDADFETAFQTALRREDTILLQTFLDGGATPRQIGAALRVAAASGATKAAKLLLPSASSGDVDAALITASFVEIWRGSPIQYPEIVQLLLTRKPSQTALNAAMISAAEDDEASIVQILLKAGANVKARNAQGETALFRAAADLRDDRNVRALLDAGADPNARGNKGDTVLFNAGLNFLDIIELLLARGANPHIPDAKGHMLVRLLESRLNLPGRDSPKEKAKLMEIVEKIKTTSPK